jgi:hypothetical protein
MQGIHNEVRKMNRSKDFRLRRAMALIVMLFGSMVAMLARPAYGQECDPTWYDPWAAPNTAAVHSTQPQTEVATHPRKVKAVSSTQRATKAHVKRVASQTRPS